MLGEFENLEKLSIVNVVKLYRGIATADENSLSSTVRDKCMVKLSKFIDEHDDDEQILANMWLTILDIAYRTDDKKLVALAARKFGEKFDFAILSTNKMDLSD